MNRVVDARGRLCPEPLVMTKREIKTAKTGDTIEVLIDNDTSRCNVENFLGEMGFSIVSTKRGTVFVVTFILGQDIDTQAINTPAEDFCSTKIAPNGRYTLVVRSEVMGAGDDELGAMLMRACINSLGDLDSLPSHIVLYNSGVKLATEGKDTAASLAKLASTGVKIIICGTCVDFFELKAQIKVGTISNMYTINDILSKTDKIIYP